MGNPMTTAVSSTTCPKAPDGQHLYTVTDVRESDGMTYRRLCFHCHQEEP